MSNSTNFRNSVKNTFLILAGLITGLFFYSLASARNYAQEQPSESTQFSDTGHVELKVWGTQACKTTIENIAKQNTNVIAAEFNNLENILVLTFLEGTFEAQPIVQALADAGYDAEGMRAAQETYDALGNECKYTRPTY